MKKLLLIYTMLAVLLPAGARAQQSENGVAAPTLRFDGDFLVMETETQYASIFYAMADLPSSDYEAADSVRRSFSVVADGNVSTFYERPFELTKAVVLKAIAVTNDAVSDTTVMVYYYPAWQDLRDLMVKGEKVYSLAQGNSAVDENLLKELQWMLEECNFFYGERATIDSFEAEHFALRLREIISQIEEQLNVVTFSFDANGVLTVWDEMPLAEAVKSASANADVTGTITAIVWQNTIPLTNDDLQGLGNPNMLIFVNSNAQAPQNRNNVVVNGYATNVVLQDVSEGNGNFFCPQEFTAEMISYTRNFQQQTEIGLSRGWESIVLPFPVQTITNELNGVIAPFRSTASDKHFWLRRLAMDGLHSDSRIEANVPYLISMPNNQEYAPQYNQNGRVTFSSQNVQVPVTETYPTETQDNSGQFIMLVPALKRYPQAQDIYALNVGQPQGSYAEGSVFVVNSRDIRPFECFTVHHGQPAPQYIPVSKLGGTATGIETINCEPKASTQWYDLNGRQLSGTPSSKGVYLLNGRKAVVR